VRRGPSLEMICVRSLCLAVLCLLCSMAYPRSTALASDTTTVPLRKWSKYTDEEKQKLEDRWTQEKVEEVVRALRKGKWMPDYVPRLPTGMSGPLFRRLGYDLRGITLIDRDLDSVSLVSELLQGAYLWGTRLQGARLRWSNLEGTRLRDTNLQGADLRGAKLEEAELWLADLHGADLRNANLRDASLRGSKAPTLGVLGCRGPTSVRPIYWMPTYLVRFSILPTCLRPISPPQRT
jgi:hypothetical protein